MVPFNYDTDPTLANFTNDYIDGMLDDAEQLVFKEYLSGDKPLAKFTAQAIRGKQILRNTYQVKAADDFEEKLAKRIARECKCEQTGTEEDLTSA